MPYFTAEDIPEPFCDGSLTDLGWEGRWDDASRPREIVCPICRARLWADLDEYLIGEKKGLFFASVPSHYGGESSVPTDDRR